MVERMQRAKSMPFLDAKQSAHKSHGLVGRLIRTWSRLIDGQSNGRNETTVKKAGGLSSGYRDPGSSVELAPALLNIYDSYTGNGNDGETAQTAASGLAAEKKANEPKRASKRYSERKMSENKKRPLSISSLSSSSSSTSSLHRPVPKKLAITTVSNNSDVSPTTSPNQSTADVNDVTDVATDDELSNNDLTTLTEDTMEESMTESRNSSNRRDSSDSSRSQSLLERVVEEIMDTERAYVTDMLDIIQGYLDHIVDQPTLIMSTSEIDQLFGNIREIYAFNRELLARLEDCSADPVKISQCFVDHNDGFIIYTQYCTNYPNSMAVLTRCMRQTDLADMFKQRQHALKQPLPLGSYLLKPVQRILKYHLLMQNMLDNSDSFSGESARIIREAYNGMTRMAQYINEMKRKHEHAVRIQEVQSLLHQWDGEDLTTYGELLIEDTFRMCGAKAYRHLFLFNKAVLITKKRDDGSYTTKNSIMCSNLMLIESIQNEPLNFHVIPFDNPKLQITLQAKNLDHKRKWCHEIKRLILENYNAVIPEKAKHLVMNLGSHHASPSATDSGDSAKRHAAPEYLDRRRTRRKSAGFIPESFNSLNTLMRSQRGRKSNRKSEVYISSPKSSPPMTRKMSLGDIGRINMAEIMQTSMEFDRSRRGQIPRRPRPRSRSFDCGATLDLRRTLSETNEANSGALNRVDDKRSSLPREQRLETGPNTASRLSELKSRYSFKIATKLNRIDSTNIRDVKRKLKSKKNGSVESMDIDSDTESDYVNMKQRSNRNGAKDDPYMSLEFLRRAKDVILRRRPEERENPVGRSAEVVSADDTADTDSVTSSVSDHRQSTGSNTSLQPGAYDNLTFGRAFDAHMRRLADSDDDILSNGHETLTRENSVAVNRSHSFSGQNGATPRQFGRKMNVYERYMTGTSSLSPLRTLSAPAPSGDDLPNCLGAGRSLSAENSPIHLPCSRTIGSISSAESACSTSKSNQDICWTDLEDYVANMVDSVDRLPKFPVLETEDATSHELSSGALSASTDCLSKLIKRLESPRMSSPLRRKTYDSVPTPGSDTEDEEKLSELEKRKKHVYELTRAYNAKMKLEKSREIARELSGASPVLKKKGDVDEVPKRPPRTKHHSRQIILGGVSTPVSRQTSKETSPDRQDKDPATMSDSEWQGIDTGEEFIRGLESLVASESSMNTSMAESTAESLDAASTDGAETPSENGLDGDPSLRGHNIKDTIRRLEKRSCENAGFKLTLTRRGKGSIVTERVRSLERSSGSTSPKTSRAYSDIYRDKYLWDKEKVRADDKRIFSRDRANHSRCQSESELDKDDSTPFVNGFSDNLELAENLRGYVKHVVTQFQH